MGNSWSSSFAGTAIKVVAAAVALGLAAWIFASSSSSPAAHGRNQQQKSAATVSAQQIHLQQEQEDPKPVSCDCIEGKAEVGEGAENIPVASSGPAFKMSAPDGSLELEDDDDDEGDLSGTLLTTSEDDSDKKMSEASVSENLHASSPPVFRFTSLGRPWAPSSFHFGSPPVPQNPLPPFQPAGNVEFTAGGGFSACSWGQPSAPSSSEFGSPPVPQNPLPFQSAGSVEFTEGESFSLGSRGANRSGRKFVKVKRDKLRKK